MNPLYILGGLALGLFIGIVSGLFGLGGGAVLIPMLVYFYGMSQIRAQGTSLATLLLPIGFFAFWTYYKAGHVDVKLSVLIALGFMLGAWLGGIWAQHLPQIVLKRGFAVILVFLAFRLATGK